MHNAVDRPDNMIELSLLIRRVYQISRLNCTPIMPSSVLYSTDALPAVSPSFLYVQCVLNIYIRTSTNALTDTVNVNCERASACRPRVSAFTVAFTVRGSLYDILM